jgi:hypothetical protein
MKKEKKLAVAVVALFTYEEGEEVNSPCMKNEEKKLAVSRKTKHGRTRFKRPNGRSKPFY